MDLIERQTAIDALEEPPKVPDTWTDESAIGAREQWEKDVNALNSLPSAQPEIIRCRDCKWKQGAECVRFADVRPFADDFCSRAERREE